MILSQRGWIRAMKGHLALDQVADLKWREGDGPFIHFHAQTTDRLALFASNGRVYTLAGDKLPGARGFGEPVRLFDRPRRRSRHRRAADRPAGAETADRLVRRPRLRDQRRFRRWPRPARASSWSTCARARGSRSFVPIPEGADAVAVVGENRKMLIFPLAELPELGARTGRHPAALPRWRPVGRRSPSGSPTGSAGRSAARAGEREPRATFRPGARRAARRAGCRRSASRAATASARARRGGKPAGKRASAREN